MELIQNKEGLDATITVKIAQADYASKVNRELKKARQTAQVKGFRPGNAPMSLIKKLYGQPILVDEVNKLLGEAFENFEKENSERLFGKIIPSERKQQIVDFETQTDFEFVYDAGFLPEFTYQIDENTELTYYNIIVDDHIVDSEINQVLTRYCKLEPVETVEAEDRIEATTKIIKEGEEVERNIQFLEAFIPNEYKSLFLGAKVGDEIQVEIRKIFINEVDLCGMLDITKEELEIQPEVLTFTLTGVLRKVLLSLNQEFFDFIVGKNAVHSEEEFREYVFEKITENCESKSIERLYDDSIELVLEKADVAMPEIFIAKFLRHLHKEEQDITEEYFNALLKEYVEDAKLKYVLTSLLEQENIVITENMVRNEAKNVVRERLGDNMLNVSIDDFADHLLKDQQEAENILWRIKVHEVSKLLKTKAKLNIIDITLEDFNLLDKAELVAGNLEENPVIEEVVAEEIAPENNEQENTENQEINKTEE